MYTYSTDQKSPKQPFCTDSIYVCLAITLAFLVYVLKILVLPVSLIQKAFFIRKVHAFLSLCLGVEAGTAPVTIPEQHPNASQGQDLNTNAEEHHTNAKIVNWSLI